ncbi:MAG TPA: NADH-quinone oxidoreductase subunit N [Noviherbaspirillum sp.]
MNSGHCMDLWAVVPEMLLAGLALALVPVAAFVRGQWRALPAAVAIIGLAASMAVTVVVLPTTSTTAFCGTYAVDRLATFYRLAIEFAAFVSVIVLDAYFRDHRQQAHAPVLLLFATVGGLGLAASLDLGLILLFLQIVSVAGYLLVILVRSDRSAQEASLKYFIYGGAALAVMGYGLSLLFGLTGRLDLPGIGAVLADADPVWIVVAFGFVFLGYAFEVTLAPFHFWAPDVYQGASAPAAGFISVVPKIAAFAALLRFLLEGLPHHAVVWSPVMAAVAVVTMTLGNLAALRQHDLKRLLAYSSIAQAGYVLMGIAVALRSNGAVAAVNFYLLAYLLMNLAAFLVVAVLERAGGADARPALKGLARRSPGWAAVFAVALLSLAGIPPFAGFAGKVLLLTAALDGHMTWLAVAAALNMAVGLYYYAVVIAEMFFMPSAHLKPIVAGIGMAGAAALTTLGTIALGVMPGAALGLANTPYWTP